MKNVINKPRISKWIGETYKIMTISILIVFVAVALATNIASAPPYAQNLFFGLMAFALLLLGITTISIHRTKYVIRDGVLYSWSPFAVIKLALKDIKKVERTMVPAHFRVGASMYSGRFYIPGLGWTKAIITNFTDGLLITTKDKKRYLITPSNPDRFAKLLKGK